jgi:hypothetical protein
MLGFARLEAGVVVEIQGFAKHRRRLKENALEAAASLRFNHWHIPISWKGGSYGASRVRFPA